MKNIETEIPEPPVACVPGGVPVDKRERWIEMATEIYASVLEVKDLPNGYSLRLPNDPTSLILIAEYVSLDRLCCEFVNWNIEVERSKGPVWLHLTGGRGVKEYFKTGFESITLLREEVARAAGFDTSNRKPWSMPVDPTQPLHTFKT